MEFNQKLFVEVCYAARLAGSPVIPHIVSGAVQAASVHDLLYILTFYCLLACLCCYTNDQQLSSS
jgi:hypothetical protein